MRGLIAFLVVTAIVAGSMALLAQSPQPKDSPATAMLHADEQVRKLSKKPIDKEWNYFGFWEIPCLDVVPAGKISPRGEVFKALGLDDTRLREFRSEPADRVVFLLWQVSASYDICCMSANNFDTSSFIDWRDPRRGVYGIRLVKRAKSP